MVFGERTVCVLQEISGAQIRVTWMYLCGMHSDWLFGKSKSSISS